MVSLLVGSGRDASAITSSLAYDHFIAFSVNKFFPTSGSKDTKCC